jgi:hypothetical protein
MRSLNGGEDGGTWDVLPQTRGGCNRTRIFVRDGRSSGFGCQQSRIIATRPASTLLGIYVVVYRQQPNSFDTDSDETGIRGRIQFRTSTG